MPEPITPDTTVQIIGPVYHRGMVGIIDQPASGPRGRHKIRFGVGKDARYCWYEAGSLEVVGRGAPDWVVREWRGYFV